MQWCLVGLLMLLGLFKNIPAVILGETEVMWMAELLAMWQLWVCGKQHMRL